MTWNWQQPDWPNFSDKSLLDNFEKQLLLSAGFAFGTLKHLNEEDKQHQQRSIKNIGN